MLRAVAGLALVFLAGCQCGLTPLSHIVGPGSIEGRVCDPGQGQGIFGADVYVVSKGKKVATTTDGHGDFTLSDVPPGTYTLFVEKGSFSTSQANIKVAEDKATQLPQEQCIKPEASQMLVVSGHDSVESVLTKLGYDNFLLVESHYNDHTSSTPSWFLQAFSDESKIASYDIVFINCGAHEWSLDDFDQTQVNAAVDNLRTYVKNGGQLYISDWAYDIMNRLYPDAATWYGDGTENAAQKAVAQSFTGNVVDTNLAGALGKSTASIVLPQSQVAIATSLGATSTALITADLDIETSRNHTEHMTDIPVLFETKPADATGRVLFTSFHNGTANTSDMDEVLRAIVFTL
jgi:hypothetical protein